MHCQVSDRPFRRREQANLALKERVYRAFAGGTASLGEDCMNMNMNVSERTNERT